MILALSILLLVNGVFNVVVWPQFLKRVARDERARDAAGKATPFLIVHVVLVTIALVVGLVSLVFGVLGLLGVGI
ncbi:SCO4848 family membrane protein [Plantibacter sp. Mn2098]|uniref:SCO4848 family membrane protein n=1 Tax=Plantibacter sp. Mn2098 TaxID=3395266 RepID=UPI003BC3B651